jgi:hypothetical protein
MIILLFHFFVEHQVSNNKEVFFLAQTKQICSQVLIDNQGKDVSEYVDDKFSVLDDLDELLNLLNKLENLEKNLKYPLNE